MYLYSLLVLFLQRTPTKGLRLFHFTTASPVPCVTSKEPVSQGDHSAKGRLSSRLFSMLLKSELTDPLEMSQVMWVKQCLTKRGRTLIGTKPSPPFALCSFWGSSYSECWQQGIHVDWAFLRCWTDWSSLPSPRLIVFPFLLFSKWKWCSLSLQGTTGSR